MSVSALSFSSLVSLSNPSKKKPLRCSIALWPARWRAGAASGKDAVQPRSQRVLRIAKAIGIAMQRSRPCHGGVFLTSVHDVHQVGFHPAFHHVPVLREAQELVTGIQDVINELVHRQLALVAENARIASMLKSLEQAREHPIHLDGLEVEIADLRESELLSFSAMPSVPLAPLSAASSWRAPFTGPCSKRISTRPSSWRARREVVPCSGQQDFAVRLSVEAVLEHAKADSISSTLGR